MEILWSLIRVFYDIAGSSLIYSRRINMGTKVHKVFISFHHGNKELDPVLGEYWKDRFELLFHDTFEAIISKSV